MEDSSEIWRPIKGFENYEVSSMGRVRSLDRYEPHNKGGKRLVRGRVLKPAKDNNGYLRVNLYQDGSFTTERVHRLVAQAFIENPDQEHFTMINHKDENPANNVWTNLEWCDYKYNNNYGTCIQRRTKKRSKAVLAYDSNGNVVHCFESTMDARRRGFDSGTVSKCCRGKLKTHKGLYWRFADDSSEG